MKQIFATIILSLVLTGSLYGCGDDSSTALIDGAETFHVDSYKDACVDGEARLCLVVQRENDSSPRVFRGEISGLKFEWGKRQAVRVARMEDGSYQVVEQLETVQESFDRGFILELPVRTIVPLGDCVFALGEEVKFTSAAPRVCRQLLSLIRKDGDKYFQFSFTGSSVIPIRLDSIGSAEGQHRE